MIAAPSGTVNLPALLALALLAIVVLVGCGTPSVPPSDFVTVARTAGTWQGSGDATLGFVSDTGRFRVYWETQRETAPRMGTFRVTVHSAVSGRPLQLLIDHQGDGRGEAEFADDPRQYNLMVESANVDWSLRVDEISVAVRPAP